MTTQQEPRKPRAFSLDEPELQDSISVSPAGDIPEAPSSSETGDGRITLGEVKRGARWGAIFLSAMVSLAGLAASLAFARFVSDALSRNDWIGWTATALAVTGLIAAVVIAAKEIVGLVRLSRLSGLKQDVAAALRDNDVKRERAAVDRLTGMFANRPDLKWGLARFKEHKGEVLDPGDLIRLAERELVAPIDTAARRLIMRSAKRVSMVTALSPFVWIAMLYVLAENLRMLRSVATLYGGRPGFVGSLRIARLVVAHILATGGLAMTDDLLGQFLGQDLLARLSRRLGEGMFNGAMTARIGTAAVDVTRPLPFLEAEPVRVRDLVPELLRSFTAKTAAAPKKP